MRREFLYILLVMALCGCFKDEDYDTTVVLRPTEQTVSGGDFVSYPDCVAYAFAADTTKWEILTWEDARDGVLSSKSDPTNKLAPFVTSQIYTESGLEGERLSMKISRSEAMIVVASSTTENYGYVIYEVGLNLSKTYIDAPRFRTWKEGEYTEGNWIYYAPEILVTE